MSSLHDTVYRAQMARRSASRARSHARHHYYGHKGDAPAAPVVIPKYEIIHQGTANAAVKVSLKDGESIVANAGAMVYADAGAKLSTSLARGGLIKTIRRAMAGASTTQNTYRCDPCPSWVVLNAPGSFGDIVTFELRPGETWFGMMKGFVASTPNIDMKMYMSTKSLFASASSGNSAVKFVNSGSEPGRVWLKAYGGATKIDLKAGEGLTVDEGSFVVSDRQPQFTRPKGMKALFASGEGLMFKFQGPATVYVQSVERTLIR